MKKVVKFKLKRKKVSWWKNKKGNRRDLNARPIASQAELLSIMALYVVLVEVQRCEIVFKAFLKIGGHLSSPPPFTDWLIDKK